MIDTKTEILKLKDFRAKLPDDTGYIVSVMIKDKFAFFTKPDELVSRVMDQHFIGERFWVTSSTHIMINGNYSKNKFIRFIQKAYYFFFPVKIIFRYIPFEESNIKNIKSLFEKYGV